MDGRQLKALAQGVGQVRLEEAGEAGAVALLEREIADFPFQRIKRWAHLDSNRGPPHYQCGALTN